MNAFADRPIVERACALQVIMGALKIAWYPPDARSIQARIAAETIPQARGLENLRQELAALSPGQFFEVFKAGYNPLTEDAEEFGLVSFGPMGGTHAAYGRALADTSEPNPRYLRHFQKEGYEGEEAVFMARFLNQVLEHLGEPERSEFEESVVGAAPEAERRKRWVKFISKHPPAWLLAYMARAARERSKRSS